MESLALTVLRVDRGAMITDRESHLDAKTVPKNGGALNGKQSPILRCLVFFALNQPPR